MTQFGRTLLAEITRDAIRNAVFKSGAELEAAVMRYLENRNAGLKPFVSSKPSNWFLDKIAERDQRCSHNTSMGAGGSGSNTKNWRTMPDQDNVKVMAGSKPAQAFVARAAPPPASYLTIASRDRIVVSTTTMMMKRP